MRNFLKYLFVLAVVLAPGAVPSLLAQNLEGKELTQSSLVFDSTAAAPGKTVQVGVLWRMAEGYHLYFKYPGDSGLQPTIEWKLPDGVKIGELRWPVPELYKDRGGNETYIYPKELLLAATLTLPEDYAGDTLEVTANAGWLVCESACYDGSATLTASVPVVQDLAQAEPANLELFFYWEQRVPTLTALSAMPLEDFTWAREDKTFTLTLKGLELPEGTLVSFIPTTPPPAVLDHPSAPQPVSGPDMTITVPAFAAPDPLKELEGILVAELPAEKVGKGWPKVQSWVLTKLPTSDFGDNESADSVTKKLAVHETTPPPGSGAGTGASAALGADTASGDGGVAAKVAAEPPANPAFLYILWMAFLGGLVLNVMPCVLPAISLKILGFIRDANEEPRKIALMGLAFAAGVFSFFMALAALSVGLTASSQGLSWGVQFQSPLFVAGMSIVMLLFALNMFGLFEITLPGKVMQGATRAASHGGFWGAFMHGLLATLLATACTAPFMGFALSATLGQPAWFTFAVLAALALGMSSPYLLLAARPQWMKFLPKPGAWMESFKQFMGFFLLATVVWLLWNFAGIASDDAVYWLLLALLGISAAVWFWGVARPASRTATGRHFASAMILLLTAGSAWILWDQAGLGGGARGASLAQVNNAAGVASGELPETSIGESGKIEWTAWSPEIVQQGIAEGRVIYIDFTARWCANCLTNKKLVIDTAPIQKAFAEHKVLALKADWTRKDEDIREAITGYGRVGIPLNVVYGPGLPDGGPLLLPEILTHEVVLDALSKAAAGSAANKTAAAL